MEVQSDAVPYPRIKLLSWQSLKPAKCILCLAMQLLGKLWTQNLSTKCAPLLLSLFSFKAQLSTSHLF